MSMKSVSLVTISFSVLCISEAAGPYADKPGIMNIKVKPMTEDFRSTLKQQHVCYLIFTDYLINSL